MNYNDQVVNAINMCKNACDLVFKILKTIDFNENDVESPYKDQKNNAPRCGRSIKVNFKNMTVDQRREYWRWTKFNKKLRNSNKPTISFDEYRRIYE